jgi:hypothetical protein
MNREAEHGTVTTIPEPGRNRLAGAPGGVWAVGSVYFILFLAHSVWRTTFQNNAVNNFGLNGEEVGVLFSLTYIPGIFCFTIGFFATRVPLYRLLITACLLLATGLFVVAAAAGLSGLAFGTLLISFGFTFFYTVANAACLAGNPGKSAAVSLARLKSLGPLAGLCGALLLLYLFAPGLLVDAIAIVTSREPGQVLPSLFSLLAAKPDVDSRLLQLLLTFLGGSVLLLGWLLGRRLRLRTMGTTYGALHIRRQLMPYYTLNFLAGSRSAIFQSFAIFVMVKQFGLPIHGTAALVLAGFISSFFGYRVVGRALRHFSHRAVLTVMYLVVAGNFLGFWLLIGHLELTPDQALLALGTLFVIDSAFFGVSVVTDSHLRRTGVPSDYVGDVAMGMTLFSLAAILMSLVGAALWQPFGADAFLLGSLVCLIAVVVGRRLSGEAPTTNH